ncbi:GNAT family N-acetyltransferase [Shigella flexneri]
MDNAEKNIIGVNISFSTLPYGKCESDTLSHLYKLRYQTFKERLDWEVNCYDNLEFDEYDGEHATYIIGKINGLVICAVRFICISHPNMITGTFGKYFNLSGIDHKSKHVESSRFFVDKNIVHMLKLRNVSHSLFLEMFDFAKKCDYKSILTIVSKPMLQILNRSGWNLEILQRAEYSEKETIFLVELFLDRQSRLQILRKVNIT